MFNLNEYEDVAARIKRVHDNYPMNRFNIRDFKIDHEKGYVYVVTEVYRDANDPYPAAVDIAYESRSDRGVNKDFWVENCVTSSYGRCAGLLLGSDKRPTRNDMEKVQRINQEKPKITMENESDPWTIKTIEEPNPVKVEDMVKTTFVGAEQIPLCKHGQMFLKEGVGDNGPYHGYVCKIVGNSSTDKCKPIWYEMKPSGKWGPKEKKPTR